MVTSSLKHHLAQLDGGPGSGGGEGPPETTQGSRAGPALGLDSLALGSWGGGVSLTGR